MDILMMYIDSWDWYIYKGNILCTTGYTDKTKKSSSYAEAQTKMLQKEIWAPRVPQYPT